MVGFAGKGSLKEDYNLGKFIYYEGVSPKKIFIERLVLPVLNFRLFLLQVKCRTFVRISTSTLW